MEMSNRVERRTVRPFRDRKIAGGQPLHRILQRIGQRGILPPPFTRQGRIDQHDPSRTVIIHVQSCQQRLALARGETDPKIRIRLA